jgi:hypothetical protein
MQAKQMLDPDDAAYDPMGQLVHAPEEGGDVVPDAQLAHVLDARKE